MQLLEKIHWIGGVVPAADAFAGTVTSDVFEVQGEGAVFIIYGGTNAGGDSTVTVLACDDTTPSNTTAVPFYYKSSTTFDTWGDWSAASSTGITTPTSSNYMKMIYVPASELASEGYGYVQLQLVEDTAAAVDACVLAGVVNPRFVEQPESLID